MNRKFKNINSIFETSFCVLTFYPNFNCNFEHVSFWRAVLSILFPPLAVLDKGCGFVFIVTVLTIFGWIPGIIAALIILTNQKNEL